MMTPTRLALLACAVLPAVVPSVTSAQSRVTSITQIEAGASGGFLNASPDAFGIRSAANGQRFALRTAHAGVHTMWNVNALDADAEINLSAASAFGSQMTRALGALHFGTHRGAFSASLGFEQSMGVSTRSNTRGDTAITPPPGSDTLGSTVKDGFSALSSSTNTVRAEDVVGALGWSAGSSRIQLLAGLRTNDRPGSTWIGANLGIGIGMSSALIVAARLQRQSATIRTPAMTLGFRTAYWRWGNSAPATKTAAQHTPASVVRLDVVGDSVQLHVRRPNATHVTIAGDATDWRLLDMIQQTDGWWSATLHVTGPVSRIQLRDDGNSWGPIPGLATTRDEYGGIVSLLVRPTKTAQ